MQRDKIISSSSAIVEYSHFGGTNTHEIMVYSLVIVKYCYFQANETGKTVMVGKITLPHQCNVQVIFKLLTHLL